MFIFSSASHPHPLLWIMAPDRLFKFIAQLCDREMLTNQLGVKARVKCKKNRQWPQECPLVCLQSLLCKCFIKYPGYGFNKCTLAAEQPQPWTWARIKTYFHVYFVGILNNICRIAHLNDRQGLRIVASVLVSVQCEGLRSNLEQKSKNKTFIVTPNWLSAGLLLPAVNNTTLEMQSSNHWCIGKLAGVSKLACVSHSLSVLQGKLRFTSISRREAHGI